jgi:hypothetical protein
MANKFLGLDSINVLKQYIDEQLIAANINTRIITIQAYAYYKDGITPVEPNGGGFDTEAIGVAYPNGWYSLKQVLNSLPNQDKALSEGAIWMSVGVVEGTNNIEWSTPMKVSGQNGISVHFQYSYNRNAIESERYSNPKGVTAENRVEYVWTKTGDNNWEGPAIWAMYSKDAREVYWKWRVTAEDEVDKNNNPIRPDKPQTGDSRWVNNIANMSLSQDYPYMWMSYQIVPSGSQANDDNWTDPVLFGHWGRDGSVPDYTATLYHIGLNDPEITDVAGIIAPTKPEFVEGAEFKDYIKDGWVELPEESEIESGLQQIWWQCTFKVNGRTNKVVSTEDIGAVKRYNAVDGTAKPGQFTLNLYAWSENQDTVEMSETLIDGWRPDNYEYLPDKPFDENGNIIEKYNNPEASLWMITANVQGFDENGKPIVNGSWSEPVKLTGPRGPIAYDYRMESRYCLGTSESPKEEPDEAEWTVEVPDITNEYKYIWVKNFLVCYKMKYSDTPNQDTGEYDIVQDGENSTIIKDYNYFRLTGLDGEDGNRKNTVAYTDTNDTVEVKSFANQNLYISNSVNDVTYNINFDNLVWIKGYTGKFANIGTGNVIINSGKVKFVGSTTTKTSITLLPQETVELVCHTINNEHVLLVIGKDIN